ncbi:hypothetical protein E0L36_16610 [Streptomyces sp. AJS327]|nr:hypothetical protein [Streptomyces sp. AJS327]
MLPLVLLAGTGCSAEDDERGNDSGEAGKSTPHGYVEGAEEAAEHQPRLVTLDAATGRVQLVDLITEKVTGLGRVAGARDLTGDGRFAYVGTANESRVYDSGVWMVDHGDHVHYYRAEPASVGTVPGGRPHGAYSDAVTTALTGRDGHVSLLDRARLEDGDARRTHRLDGSASQGAVVPYEKQLLVPERESKGAPDRVRLHGRDGEPRRLLDGECPELRGQAVTPQGVVFGCADGALLVSHDEGKFTTSKIPYPEKVEEKDRAREFRHRPGSATLAARAGERGVWTLDVAGRGWKRTDTGRTVLAVNSVGQDEPTLALTADGVLRAYDPGSGAETARQRLLAKPVAAEDGGGPVIELDNSRAYVNDAAARKVHEVDYQDELRLARSLRLPSAPTHMVETGR